MELEGNKGLLVTEQSSVAIKACMNRFPLFGRFEWVLGPFWAKKGCFGAQKCAVVGGHLPTWRPCPGAPPVSFWLKTWIWQGHHLEYEVDRVE